MSNGGYEALMLAGRLRNGEGSGDLRAQEQALVNQSQLPPGQREGELAWHGLSSGAAWPRPGSRSLSPRPSHTHPHLPTLSDPSYLHPTILKLRPKNIMATTDLSRSASHAADIKSHTSREPSESHSPASSSAAEIGTTTPTIQPKPSSAPTPGLPQSTLATAAAKSPVRAAVASPSPLSNANNSPMASAVSNGPIAKAIQVPARPRPGRKTAVDEPTSKRKAQNRQAQRNFRQRKLEHAVSLEASNQELRTENQQLAGEVKRLQHVVQESQQLQARVQRELDDFRRRFNDNEERWNASLNAMGALQDQIRAEKSQQTTWRARFEAKSTEFEALERKVAGIRQPSQFNASKRMLPPISTASPRSSSSHSTPGGPSMKPHSATDGCGNCEETGECACVDPYIDSSHTTKEVGDVALRRASTMSITSMLSPQDSRRTRARRDLQAVPDMIVDASSENDALETDFTNFSKSATIAVVQLDRGSAESPSTAVYSETCGFCTDSSNCLCSEVKLNSSKQIDLSIQPSQAPTATRLPGSCSACLANPDQKAFCESLARERATSHQTGSSSDGRNPKRPRLEPSVRIPCADAYPIYQRFSHSRENVTYETLYSEFLKNKPSSEDRRNTEASINTADAAKTHQFSAFEADIVEVLVSLHRANSKPSSGSAGSPNTKSTSKSGTARQRVER